MQDKVSIIVPVYNAQNYIEKTVNSVLEQDYENWELLLVENGSSDNSVEVMKRYDDSRIRLIVMEGNVGAANARNEGMKLAEGRYVSYLDADDLWQKNKLSLQLAFMKEKDAAFSFTYDDRCGRNYSPACILVRTVGPVCVRPHAHIVRYCYRIWYWSSCRRSRSSIGRGLSLDDNGHRRKFLF